MNAIIVLGSSFIEALPVPPESCAESIFFAKIKKNDRNYQVINLGYSGHDPYDSYLRLLYYEKYYHPSKVLLVLNSNNSEWLNRHNYPFNFEESDNFGKKQSGIKIKSMKFLKNHLSSFNLIANFILNSDENINNAESGQTNTNQDISHVQKLIKLFDCLSAFKKNMQIIFFVSQLIQIQYLIK